MDAEYRTVGDESELHQDVPEQRLMLAILEDALAIFRRGLGRASCAEIHKFREVDRWFRSDESDWPFSFECICSTLRIDADYVRLGLNLIRQEAFEERRRDAPASRSSAAHRLGIAGRRPDLSSHRRREDRTYGAAAG